MYQQKLVVHTFCSPRPQWPKSFELSNRKIVVDLKLDRSIGFCFVFIFFIFIALSTSFEFYWVLLFPTIYSSSNRRIFHIYFVWRNLIILGIKQSYYLKKKRKRRKKRVFGSWNFIYSNMVDHNHQTKDASNFLFVSLSLSHLPLSFFSMYLGFSVFFSVSLPFLFLFIRLSLSPFWILFYAHIHSNCDTYTQTYD